MGLEPDGGGREGREGTGIPGPTETVFGHFSVFLRKNGFQKIVEKTQIWKTSVITRLPRRQKN